MPSSLPRGIFRYGGAALASGADFQVRPMLAGVLGSGLPTYLILYPPVMLAATPGAAAAEIERQRQLLVMNFAISRQ